MSGNIPATIATGYWTLDRVADALQAWFGDPPTAWPRGATAVRAIATDTRAIENGDVFVALRGEKFDAHDFLKTAVENGAAALVVTRPEAATGLGVPVYTVPDTLLALGALARAWRRAWGKTLIGVAGSNGKTGTKELLRAALGRTFDVHATSANLNNRVGVPLTILGTPPSADLAVIEMGTSLPGEVAALRAVAEPDIAIVTSVAEEHLEGLGDLAGVLREEAAAFDAAPLAICPASQPEVVEEARRRAKQTISVGLDEGDWHPAKWGVEPDGLGWIELDGVMIRPPVRGVHNLRNAMLALAAARACGVPLESAAAGIAEMPAPAMRLAWARHGDATVINDAYNSNPGSARAAIELLEHAGKGRQRVLVLGTMRELGPGAAALHEEIARRALDAGLEVVAGLGDFAAPLTAAADPRAITGNDVDDLWAALRPRLARDAVILLKASRGVKLERILPHIEQWAAGGAA